MNDQHEISRWQALIDYLEGLTMLVSGAASFMIGVAILVSLCALIFKFMDWFLS